MSWLHSDTSSRYRTAGLTGGVSGSVDILGLWYRLGFSRLWYRLGFFEVDNTVREVQWLKLHAVQKRLDDRLKMNIVCGPSFSTREEDVSG
jgi:hypothetical protein